MNIRISIFVIAAALFAVSSFGQSHYQVLEPVGSESGGGWADSTTYSNGSYMDNPCTAAYDALWIDYSAYVDGAQAEAGLDRYLFNEDTTMSGSYAASGSSAADVAYSAPFSVRKYHKVNTPDNFHVVTVITFDPATHTTSVSVETACGNGMPDSQE